MDIIQAERWAVVKMTQHGLLAEGWTFDFDRSRKRLGLCNFGTKTITVSIHYTKLNDEHIFEDTVLHEIAHALAGHRAGHGPKWRQVCIDVGALPKRLQGIDGLILPPRKYVATCPHCLQVHYYTRLPKKRVSCGYCTEGKFDITRLLTFSHHAI